MDVTTIGPKAYRVTDADRLWLGRAVEAESHDPQDRARVAQVLINRFQFLRSSRPKLYPTLADFVRAYSQPVNPRWAPGGDKFEAQLAAATTPQTQQAVRQLGAKRLQHASRAPSATTRAAIDRALKLGPVDIPRTATDFGAPFRSTPGHLVRLTEHQAGANTLYRVRNASWQGYSVRAETGLWIALVCAAAGAIAWVRKKGGS